MAQSAASMSPVGSRQSQEPMARNPFGVKYYVGNTTNPAEDQGISGVTPRQMGRTAKNPFSTIQAAIDESVSGRGDTIVIQRGTYTENLSVNKAGLTFRGANPGHGHVTISGRTVVTVSGVSFFDLDFFSNDASLASVRCGAFTDAANAYNSLWFERCGFVSDGVTEPEAGLLLFGGDAIVVKDCDFVDNTFGILIHSSAGEFCSDLTVLGNRFTENTTAHIGTAAGEIGLLGEDSGVRNFVCMGNVFNRGEVTPTDYVRISGTSSGIFCGNYIAIATNSVADIIIPAGILYIGNYTQAGLTTDVPT